MKEGRERVRSERNVLQGELLARGVEVKVILESPWASRVFREQCQNPGRLDKRRREHARVKEYAVRGMGVVLRLHEERVFYCAKVERCR